MSLGKKLQDLRNSKGITQKELAEMMGIGQSTIAMYETDKREPDLATLAQFVNFYNISFNEILSYLPTLNHPEEPGRSQNYMTPEEIELIRRRRKVTDTTKDTIDRLIQADEILKKNSNASPFSS